MALFRPNDPTKQLQRDLDAATIARAKLTERLAAAEADIIAATSAAQQLALSGADDTSLDRAEATLRARADRKATLLNALAQADATVAELTIDLADVADQATRAATIAELKALGTRFENAGKTLTVAIKEMAEIAAIMTPFIPEAGSLSRYCASSGIEIPEAVLLVEKLVGYHSASVRRGEASATLRKPQAIVKRVNPQPVAPTVRLFALRPIKWRAGNGLQIVGQKFQDCELPPATAKKALALRACVPLDDPLARQHRGTVAGHPDAKLAFDLDAEPCVVATAEPILASSASPFTVVDRGGPIPVQMRVAR